MVLLALVVLMIDFIMLRVFLVKTITLVLMLQKWNVMICYNPELVVYEDQKITTRFLFLILLISPNYVTMLILMI